MSDQKERSYTLRAQAGTHQDLAAPVTGEVSPKMQGLVTALWHQAMACMANAPHTLHTQREILLSAIAAMESTITALIKENADNQRQLLIAEGVTEKLDDNNAALRTENAALRTANESLRQDAERLDWLENSPNASMPIARVDWSSEPRPLRRFIDGLRASLTAGSEPR